MIIEYEALTRGSYYKSIISDQTISVINKQGGMPVVTRISDTDWSEIIDLYKKVDLKGMPNLKAPSERRFYDGAAIASFKIIVGETTYQCPEFDGGYPPAAIEKIVNKIAAFSQKQK